MQFPRSSGILLHPTSLPGRYGIGDIGDAAFRFVDFLTSARQTIWQVLPLGPTSFGDSPYQSLSAFAGNPLLISLDKLVEEGWLTTEDLANVPPFSNERVDYGNVIAYHDQMLSLAYERFASSGTAAQKATFNVWCAANIDWLDDFAVFATLKDVNGGKAWVEWPEGQALRHSDAIARARNAHRRRIAEHSFRQWVFFTQWKALKAYANGEGIRLIGDIPIFVAHDSSDVWGNRDLFYLDETGRPTVIAGVPPDYFSATGQRWGNPLYRWDVLAEDNYSWWIRRFKALLGMVDIIRIDHFRGFEAYWEVPAEEETAVNGRWVPGPGNHFFDAVNEALGELPIIAEDLGLITPGVEALRDHYNLPGMKVLQFAFSDDCADNDYLPHNFVPNCVVYTGTHDNNTTVGWWQHETSKAMRRCIKRYVGYLTKPHWDLIRLAMMSVAHTAIVPLQDVFGLGAEHRMNTPGVPGGNWSWRFPEAWLDHPARKRMAALAKLYGRAPEVEEPEVETADEINEP
jgi:4-alpha-glucanotransferase